MIVPKLSRYYVEELLNGEPCGYCLVGEYLSPEEAVEHYLKQVPSLITLPINDQVTFYVQDMTLEAHHYVQATYGWSCKKICKPKKEL